MLVAEGRREQQNDEFGATGNDIKVVQELMRHAKLSTTMEVYTQAAMPKKRLAQRKAVDVLFNRNAAAEKGSSRDRLIAPILRPVSDEHEISFESTTKNLHVKISNRIV
ncbi:hypothetical protein [Silvibacterium dinghuense]|uniref:Tyr recombinase domain-containing protein n=1 Tax=Silvibacterium dinghuense TaxID=1560006 RepID=A0A4V1NVA6_9BACT|nr:hypothetical protein [Silvibacterium dinghuense]RXS95100.1 hypothetical protein ESZ00_10805 [Silvibacterium dinghuense]